MKTLIFSMVLMTTRVFSQVMFIPADYSAINPINLSIREQYQRTFINKRDALKRHLEVLDSNFVEFDRNNGIEPDLNCPIFLHYKDPYDDGIVYVTYVRRLNNGKFESVFSICDDESMQFFNSDGYILVYEPKERRKKKNRNH